MIVSPDFPDHWKTRHVISQCGPESVLCILRLWAHCQQRHKWKFDNLTPEILASICAWSGDKNTLWTALLGTFIDEVRGKTIHVIHDWEQVNASLIRNWENGKKGGRPRNPRITQRKPMGSLGLTQSKPIREDRIGVEKKREEGEKEDAPGKPSHSDSPAKAFTVFWCEMYLTATGRTYVHQGAKDGTAVNRILAMNRSAQDLIDLAKWALTLGDSFIAQQASTISSFSANISRIETARATATRNGHKKPIDKDTNF